MKMKNSDLMSEKNSFKKKSPQIAYDMLDKLTPRSSPGKIIEGTLKPFAYNKNSSPFKIDIMAKQYDS